MGDEEDCIDLLPHSTPSPPDREKESLPKDIPVSEDNVQSELDTNELFGKKFYEDVNWAPDVNPDLVVRLEEILVKGIPDDFLKELLKKFPPPKNCALLVAPKLNDLIKTVMPESVVMRDDKITMRQNKIAAALSAVSKVVTDIVMNKNVSDLKSTVDTLLDVGKLVADLYHDESVIRRHLIMANVDKSMTSTLNAATIDEFLFGKNLEETVKSAKALETAGKDLRKSTQKPKNFKFPSRGAQKPFAKSGGTQKTQFRSQKKSPKRSKYRSPKRVQHRHQSPARKESRSSRTARR